MKRAFDILCIALTIVLAIPFILDCGSNPNATSLLDLNDEPDSVALEPGEAAAVTLSGNVFNKQVQLAFNVPAPGVDGVFLPDPLVLPNDPITSRKLLLTANTNPAPAVGNYTGMINWLQIGGASGSTNLGVQVQPSALGGFTIQLDPTATAPAGTMGTYNVQVGAFGNFSGNVSLSSLGLSFTTAFNPPIVNVPMGGTAPSVMTVQVPTNQTATRNFQFAVLGSNVGTTPLFQAAGTANLTAIGTAPSFTLNVSPSAFTFSGPGQTNTFNINLQSVNGFNGMVSLAVSGVPSFLQVTQPSPVTVNLSGTGTSTFTVATTPTAVGQNPVHLIITATGPTPSSIEQVAQLNLRF